MNGLLVREITHPARAVGYVHARTNGDSVARFDNLPQPSLLPESQLSCLVDT
jgi:hypothetical protein